jgi:hypothetical protein
MKKKLFRKSFAKSNDNKIKAGGKLSQKKRLCCPLLKSQTSKA